MPHWLFLTGAILLEVAGTVSMKLSNGFTKITPSILLFIIYLASFVALTFALKKIDVSIAYTIWAGVGTALIAIIGILYFREPVTVSKFVSISFIIFGVIGLSLTSPKL